VRVLLVAPMPPAPGAPGAIPRVLDAQLEGLLVRHDVSVAAIAGPEQWELDALDALRKRGVDVHGVRRHEPEGRARWQRRWRLGSRWLSGGWPWRTVWFYEQQMQRLLDRLLAEEHYDVVAIEDNSMGVYRFGEDVPTVLTEHEVRRPRALAPPPWQPDRWASWAVSETDWRRWGRYLTNVWQRFDALQVFTDRDAALMAELAPGLSERVCVNPFGIVLPRLDPIEGDEPNQIVFAGNYTHAPNVDAACWLAEEILPLVRRTHPAARLTLIGHHAPPRIRALEAADVELAGFVPDVDETLRRAAVVAAPIRIGGGMRMKVLHAMALGKAVVTTPRGIDGLRVPGEEAPALVGETAQQVADGMVELFRNQPRRDELGQSAREFVGKHYSPAAYASRLEETYESTIARHANASTPRSVPREDENVRMQSAAGE
jgi:glycosyltransferase involved in cell wall biosynthesis